MITISQIFVVQAYSLQGKFYTQFVLGTTGTAFLVSSSNSLIQLVKDGIAWFGICDSFSESRTAFTLLTSSHCPLLMAQLRPTSVLIWHKLQKCVDARNLLMRACELLTWCTFWNVVTSFSWLNVPQFSVLSSTVHLGPVPTHTQCVLKCLWMKLQVSSSVY